MQFSIIIPAKNEESNIAFCLAAIKCQNVSNDNYEIIVIDNGSTDDTVLIAKTYGVAVHSKPELSLSGLRNFGASIATGDILVFLDADCIPDHDWLNSAGIALLDPNVGCTGSTPYAPANGTWVETIWSSFRTRRKDKCCTSWINSSNLFIRKELFFYIGGFNESVMTSEDVDICMRIDKICNIVFNPGIKVVHTGEPKTIKNFFNKEIWRGKGAISGLLSHGIKLSELRSILLPIYYFCTSIAILTVIFFYKFSVITILLFLYFLPALIFTIWIIMKTKQLNYFFGYFILFLVYANARAASFFLAIINHIFQNLQFKH